MSSESFQQDNVDFLDRTVMMCELRQKLIYSGGMEGLPTIESNQEMIDYIIKCEKSSSQGMQPYLIQPIEEPIDYTGSDPYEFGTPSLLPPVLCIARLKSINEIRNTNGDWSALTVVWFQNSFALPIDKDVAHHLRQVDWNLYATNFEY